MKVKGEDRARCEVRGSITEEREEKERKSVEMKWNKKRKR